ncbi:MAG: hypothetical protein AAFR47_00025 [Pseudomonadota bacterium]
MNRSVFVALSLATALPVHAQEQQAGNAASTDVDGTYQALIEKCDDVDALMLRARIRLQLPRTTEEAAATAQKMLDDAFATCGGGDLEGAKAQLTEALALAEAGASEVFEAEASEEATEETAAAEGSAPAAVDDEQKPWWRFW